MTKFLCLIAAMTLSLSAMAQDANNTLFPELQRRNAPTTTANAPVNNPSTEENVIPSLFDTDTPADIAARERQMIQEAYAESEDVLSDTFKRTPSKPQIQKNEEGLFVFKPSEVQAVIPSIERFAFCIGQLTLYNNTEYLLKELGVVIQYTPFDLPYTFTNLPANDNQMGKIALGGEACLMITKIPNVIVKSCKAVKVIEKDGQKIEEPLGEAECRSKVKYMMQ